MAIILVVDHDENSRNIVAWALESERHHVFTAANGVEAVAMYRSLADSIDLVITELDMPVMDGTQTILRIRMTKSKAKVICMTARPREPLPKGVILLVKPFSNRELVSCVDQTLLSARPVR